MTLDERKQAFLDSLNELSQRYGFQVGAQIQTRQLGPVVQCEPVAIVVAIDDWKEPEGTEHSNGKLVTEALP
jgi:hypothetical protein